MRRRLLLLRKAEQALKKAERSRRLANLTGGEKKILNAVLDSVRVEKKKITYVELGNITGMADQNIARVLTSVKSKLGINLREFIRIRRVGRLVPRPKLGIVKTKEVEGVMPGTLRFLNTYNRLRIRNKIHPNIEELAEETKLSRNTVKIYLGKLENMGAIPRKLKRESLRRKESQAQS